MAFYSYTYTVPCRSKCTSDYQLFATSHVFVVLSVNDNLDDILNESGDEEESQNILDKVLDEIGIEIKGKLGEAPGVLSNVPGSSKVSDDDLEKQLERLKAL